jgi:excisionase family DNA binding protein
MKDQLDTRKESQRVESAEVSLRANGISALVTVPLQRLYKVRAAAKYLGIHEQTLRKFTEEGLIPARLMGNCRVYTLEDLEAYVASLPRWYYGGGERSGASNGDNTGDQQG